MRKSIAAMFTLAIALISTGVSAQTLQANQALMAGQQIYSSNGNYKLVLQASDGNLVVYRVSTNAVIWATNVLGSVSSNTGAVMQTDRNFVVYGDITNPASYRWNSGTGAAVVDTAAYLKLGDDGSLTIYSGAGLKVWSTPGEACPNGGRLELYPVCAYPGPFQQTVPVPACNWSEAAASAASMNGYVGPCR
ncbi:hypothetical protein [Hyalangium minutum]|uniref:Bulb-type lectin domain-containing protein n=1 Tax=Hyalangium minutum TaxID=394096 RepID=A0A085WVP7_9BACT|nr:hypothetical protein [Hyalangium minutum]KFE71760.1 hypothetical protein DB31_0021 [Hyalangium minutum]